MDADATLARERRVQQCRLDVDFTVLVELVVVFELDAESLRALHSRQLNVVAVLTWFARVFCLIFSSIFLAKLFFEAL